MARTGLSRSVATAEQHNASSGWSLLSDGPPIWLVALVFAGLVAVWLAPGAPEVLALALGGAVLLTMAVEFPRWAGHLLAHNDLIPDDPRPLLQRLDEARARTIERNRWR
jgi:hypothetical protein